MQIFLNFRGESSYALSFVGLEGVMKKAKRPRMDKKETDTSESEWSLIALIKPIGAFFGVTEMDEPNNVPEGFFHLCHTHDPRTVSRLARLTDSTTITVSDSRKFILHFLSDKVSVVR